MVLGNKSVIYNGTGLNDILCFVPTQTNSDILVIFLMGVFLVLLIVLLKNRFPKDISFLSASVTTFSLATILLLGQTQLTCDLISERAFIITLVIMLGSIIVYKYNEGVS